MSKFLIKPILEKKILTPKKNCFVYKFSVYRNSTKHDIKKEFERFFSVEVLNVNTCNKGKKEKKFRRAYSYLLKEKKHAYITTKQFVDFSKFNLSNQEEENNS